MNSRPVFAVLRLDDFFDEPLSAANVEERITLQRVWPTQQHADSEAARLNELVERRGQTGIRYFVQPTRLADAESQARNESH